MSRQLLIYERAVPVSSEKHREWSVKSGTDFSFAGQVNSVPLMAVEVPGAAVEYPIVFAGNDDEIMPAVILGLRDAENLYLEPSGAWRGRYVPAFVRRYPFVFSSNDEGKTFTLCIDEDFSGCNQDGKGERLFDSDGNRTQYLEGVLTFLKDYQAQFMRTRAFCRKLKELDLLEPMRAQVTLSSGQQFALEGFKAISRDKLKNLSGDKLAELAKTDELELAFLQMQSMRNLQSMVERVQAPVAASGGNGAEKAEAAAPAAKKKATAKKS
jgi:hypothetical protein